jgi:hypothetical protein
MEINIQVGNTEGKWQCCGVSYKTESAVDNTNTCPSSYFTCILMIKPLM